MADVLTQAQRSHNMASIRSRGNVSTEQAFTRLLRREGISGWRKHASLPGKPDFVFRKDRLAIFVDGCFWHGCSRCYRLPSQHRAYWREKVRLNRNRDRRVDRELRGLGWKILRVWEHSLESQPGCVGVLRRLRRTLGK